MTLSRRDWLLTTLPLVGLATFGGPLEAIDPIVRKGPARMKLGLAAYSFRQWLDLKKKPKPDMTLHDFIDYAAAKGCDAVELTGYYFAETTPEALSALKTRATRQGLDVSGSAVANNFCNADGVKLKADIAHVKTWTEHTSRLGGKTLRIFAGTIAKGDTEAAARERCINAIGECCEHAAKWGVYLALENHGGITANVDSMLAIVGGVRHDSFGVNLDTGNFHTADPYGDLAKIAPYAVNVQVKTEMKPAGKGTEEADLAKLVRILRDANYQGYVTLEYEAKDDAMTAVPKYLKQLRTLLGAG
jgi:sugar phosphate isomerase/epimerase